MEESFMKCDSKRSFSIKLGKLIEKAFDQSLYRRYMAYVVVSGSNSIEGFLPTVETFGSVEQVDGCRELISFLNENKEYCGR